MAYAQPYRAAERPARVGKELAAECRFDRILRAACPFVKRSLLAADQVRAVTAASRSSCGDGRHCTPPEKQYGRSILPVFTSFRVTLTLPSERATSATARLVRQFAQDTDGKADTGAADFRKLPRRRIRGIGKSAHRREPVGAGDNVKGRARRPVLAQTIGRAGAKIAQAAARGERIADLDRRVAQIDRIGDAER